MAQVTQCVDVTVEVGPDVFLTCDLIDEIEARGYTVQTEEDLDAIQKLQDDIHGLYRDFIQFNEDQTSVDYFRRKLYSFFQQTIDKYEI